MRPAKLLAISVTLLLGPLGLLPASAQLREAPTLPVPVIPQKTNAVAGDFNGDGMMDLAVGYYSQASGQQVSGIETFLRTGPSSFAPPVVSPGLPGRWGQAVAVDVNSDGRTDLILDAPVAVLVSDGAGSFNATYLGWQGYESAGVAYADFNADGHPDIMTAQKFAGGMEAFVLTLGLGDGHGSFGPFVQVAPLGVLKVGQIAAGDLNGDGAPDVVVPGLKAFLNDGTGAFPASTSVPLAGKAPGLVLTDLDGDGRLDAVVAADPGLVVFLKGDGAGGFSIQSAPNAPGHVAGILVGDFTGDGLPDVAVCGDGVWVYPGNGTLMFSQPPARYVAVNGGPWSLDLNGDGLLDIVAGNSELFNVGGGTLNAPRQFLAGAGVTAVAVGDMNGDSKPDIVTANADSNDVAVLLGNGNGGFAPPVLAPAGAGPTFLALGDWNGDGRRDVAVANATSHDVSILLGDGTGGLTPAGSLPFPGLDLRGLASGNLDNDGRDDLVIAMADPPPSYGTVRVFLASGNGSFNPGTQYALGETPGEIVLADFNSDTRLDAAVSVSPSVPYTSELFTLLGDGNGSLAAPAPQPVLNLLPPKWIVADDLNGNGNADLIVAGKALAGDGHGGFAPFPVPFPIPDYGEGGATADFDGNSIRDLAFSAGNVQLGIGDGSGGFAFLNRQFPIGGASGRSATADFNGDGRPDLAVAIQNSEVVTVLQGEAMPPGADVSLTVTHSPDPAQGGAPLAVTASLVNLGPLTATAPRLTLQLPFGVDFVSSTPGPPTCVSSQAPQMNVLVTCSFPDMAAAGTASVVVNVTVQNLNGYVLPFDTRASTVNPIDPDPLNNATVHLVPVGLTPDVKVTLSDSTDPVIPGAPFDYLINVSNVGAGNSQADTLTGTLDDVTYVSSSPAGVCTAGTFLSCNVAALGPGQGFPITVTVTAGAVTFIKNSVTVHDALDLNTSNDSATQQTQVDFGIRQELVHGKTLSESFPSGADPAERLYYVTEQPHRSYEVVVDATAGDVAGSGQTLSMQRLGTDLSPLQDAQAAGAGPSRALRWESASGYATIAEVVRVRSTGCSTGCGTGDSYRIRAYETTALIARFNTTLTQTTILVLENQTASPVQGHAWLWDEAGVLAGSVSFTLAAHQSLTSKLDTVAPGRKGSVTISHDGPYGALGGKTSAVELATGFTFDTPLQYRPR